MNYIFKYDYNNKLFLINLLLSICFLIISVFSYKETIVFVILLIMAVLLLFNSFVVIRKQGIIIDHKNKKIVIVDELLVRKLSIKDIRYVSLKQLVKKTKNKFYGFFIEFLFPHTYISHCDYVYNQGKVYNICFHMIDGTIIKSYFGWLYREKELKVKEVETKLLDFINTINILCKDTRH